MKDKFSSEYAQSEAEGTSNRQAFSFFPPFSFHSSHAVSRMAMHHSTVVCRLCQHNEQLPCDGQQAAKGITDFLWYFPNSKTLSVSANALTERVLLISRC